MQKLHSPYRLYQTCGHWELISRRMERNAPAVFRAELGISRRLSPSSCGTASAECALARQCRVWWSGSIGERGPAEDKNAAASGTRNRMLVQCTEKKDAVPQREHLHLAFLLLGAA
eukprot:1977807-Rhodomonas_salina.1